LTNLSHWTANKIHPITPSLFSFISSFLPFAISALFAVSLSSAIRPVQVTDFRLFKENLAL
jgi:hypothetical protein